MVIYIGHVVELGSTDQVFAPPYHPCTEAYLSAVPIAYTNIDNKYIVLDGDVPSAMSPPSGSPFQTRRHWKEKVVGNLCYTEVRPLRHLVNSYQIKCHRSDELLAQIDPLIKITWEWAKVATASYT